MEKDKIKELLQDMSLEEKIDQMLQIVGMYYEKDGILTGPENTIGFTEEEVRQAGTVLGSVGASKLKKIQKEYMEKQPHHIPLIFMADIINGYRTIFPIPLAQGCSFEPELAKKSAEIAAKESAVAGLHLTFSPMVDLVRDARWGRVMESTGEDPYLNGCFAEAIVKGYQGEGELAEKGKIAACVKHFAAYGAPIAGKEYNTVELSERTLRDDYLPAYEKAVKAGAEMVMTSFNTLDRVPSSANQWLMRKVLRKEMGFEGVLISDWAAIEELIAHGVAKDHKEAAKLALEAGVDIDMMTSCYCKNLEELVKEGSIKEELIDEAVLRILELKNKLGLFENPYKDADEEEEKTVILCEEHRKAAREAAAKTFVLLKNEELLPLKKQGQKTAFIGPQVMSKRLYGAWSMFGQEEETVSIQDAVTHLGLEQVTFCQGSPMLDNARGLEEFAEELHLEANHAAKEELLEEAVEKAKETDVVVMALGEYRRQSGEAASRGEITIPECQMELFRSVYAVNKNIVVVLFSGRPLDIREISSKAKAVLEVWMPGTEGGNAIADVLYGDVNPSGKLSMTFPYCVGQVPVYYNSFHTGRPFTEGNKDKYLSKYLDIPNKPLYPFGYGLSYTIFDISKVRLSAEELTREGSITASVTVRNTGNVPGAEVVQMYIQDVCGSVVRPVKELKGFERITLQPGEEREVSFTVTEEMLRFYDIHMKYVSEPGEFRIYIGNSSDTENDRSFNLSW